MSSSKVAPDKTNTFDIIVIGTGVAASTVAYKCNSAGWKVAIIDSRPFGGTCALRGCDPKKVLVGAAEVIDWNHRMQNKGLGDNIKEIQIKWPELIRFKRTFTEPVPKNREEAFSKAGIASFHGSAHFVDSSTIKVDDDDANSSNNNETIIHGRHVLIATGARPVKLNIPGEEHVTTSDQFLELDELPPKIAFIGGGYISFEFAHIAARAGAKVTILHHGKRPLTKFDPDLVDMLLQRTRDIGIDVQLQTDVKGINKSSYTSDNNNNNLVVYTSNTASKENAIETDMVVHGAGRVPEIEGLNLQAAGIKYDQHNGVKVNDYLQSISNPAVYAAGDAAVASGGLPLTPVAGYQAQIVASNLLEGNHLKPDYRGIPSVVFTISPLASVGLQEKTAKEQGLQFKTNYQNTFSWYSSRRIGESCSGFKVLIEEGSNRILGAHLLGPHAEEVINIFALAIRLGINTDKLKEAVLAYPTNSYDIGYML